MANRARGESSLELSDGRVLTLVIDHNALAEAEDAADMGVDDLLSAMRTSPRLKHLRAILYGALREKHAEFTVKDAGTMLAEGETVGAAIAEALVNAFPKLKPETAGVPHPPMTPAGTGKRSRPRGPKKA